MFINKEVFDDMSTFQSFEINIIFSSKTWKDVCLGVSEGEPITIHNYPSWHAILTKIITGVSTTSKGLIASIYINDSDASAQLI